MKRIDTATRALNLFGPGKDGFKDGDLANGIAPTDLNAAAFNGYQEELANVIEAAGIALDGNNLAQLLAALNRRSPTVGEARNVKMSVAAASASGTLTADEIVVKSALGGMAFVLPGFNKTINLATVGAGGMDTGAAPVSGFVAIYAIYNPTTGTSALLARNAAVLQPEVYGGANMPAGYTASALIGVWPTTAAGLFVAGVLQGRKVTFSPVTLLSSTTIQGSLTSLSIAAAVPANAKFISGTNSVAFSTTAGTGLWSTIASSASGIGSLNLQLGGTTTTINRLDAPFTDLAIITPQTLWYTFQTSGGTGQGITLQANSFTF
mgnify:CR=1 FL=1